MGDALSKKVSDKCLWPKGCVVHRCSKNRVLAVGFPSAVIERWHRARQQNATNPVTNSSTLFCVRQAQRYEFMQQQNEKQGVAKKANLPLANRGLKKK